MAGNPVPFVNAFDHPMAQSLRYNTSQYGSVIPIVWGRQRVSVNVLDGYNYIAPKSGKGGAVGKGKTKNGSVDVALGLCQGPVVIGSNNSAWANSGVVAVGTLPLNLYFGYDGQSPDPTFASSSPNTPVVGYSGIAYVTGTPMQLSGSVLPNFSLEVDGFRLGTAGNNTWVIVDASPALILYDMLYDARIGIHFPGPPADLSAWQNYCQAALFGFSLVCDKQQPLRSWVEELLTLTSSAAVWSSGRLLVVPYYNGQLDNNNAAYYPDLTPVARLTDDDFLPWGTGTQRSAGEQDPVLVTRADVSQLTNWVSIEIMERDYQYNPVVQPPQFDQASIELYGVRTESSIQGHEICSQAVGEGVVGMILTRKNRLRNTYKFRVGWRHILLEPMDIVALSDPILGLNQFPVRLISVEEDELGALTMTAEELA